MQIQVSLYSHLLPHLSVDFPLINMYTQNMPGITHHKEPSQYWAHHKMKLQLTRLSSEIGDKF